MQVLTGHPRESGVSSDDMHHRVHSLACRFRPIAAVVAVTVLLLMSPMPADAECNPSGADPSFRRALAYARRVIVGTVVAVAPDDLNPPGTASYRFTVAVEDVLRGAPASVIDVDRLETGACVRWLSAAEGDRIALLLDIGGSDSSIARHTAAWITGSPPPVTGYETITLGEVLDLVRPATPDTSTMPADSDDGWSLRLSVALIAGLFGGFLAWRRTGANSLRRRR